MKFLKFNIYSKEGGNNTLGIVIDEGQEKEYDIQKAGQAIHDFCTKNDIELDGDRFVTKIIISGVTKGNLDDYGINIKTMLEYCGEDPKKFMLGEEKQEVEPEKSKSGMKAR